MNKFSKLRSTIQKHTRSKKTLIRVQNSRPLNASLNSLSDTASNTLSDAPSDTSFDAPSDTLSDAPSDTLSDTSFNAASDAPSDAPSDAAFYTPSDAAFNAPSDAIVNAESDIYMGTFPEDTATDEPESFWDEAGYHCKCGRAPYDGAAQCPCW
jgi:hypothetical protein